MMLECCKLLAFCNGACNWKAWYGVVRVYTIQPILVFPGSFTNVVYIIHSEKLNLIT